VLHRPNDGTAGPSTVCPGQHTFADAGGYSVVWWDPGALDLDKKPTFGVRRDDLIVKDVPKHVIADGRATYDRWQLARHDARAAGAVPSLRVQTVREWALADPSQTAVGLEYVPESDSSTYFSQAEVRLESGSSQAEVRLVMIGQTAERPGGIGFGILVHELLAKAPFDATREGLESLAAAEARVLGMKDDEARAAAASPTLPPGSFRGVPILLKDFGAMQVGQPYYMGNRALCDARSEAISWKSKDCFVASAPAQKQNAWTHVLPPGFQLSLE